MASIRNKDGIWINTEALREPAIHFTKYGYYCADPWGSPAWLEYWQEQLRRIIYGYESSGVKITGDHYFYLKFCPIQLTERLPISPTSGMGIMSSFGPEPLPEMELWRV